MMALPDRGMRGMGDAALPLLALADLAELLAVRRQVRRARAIHDRAYERTMPALLAAVERCDAVCRRLGVERHQVARMEREAPPAPVGGEEDVRHEGAARGRVTMAAEQLGLSGVA